MKMPLVLVALFLGGMALAQDRPPERLDAAKRAVQEQEMAQAVVDAADADVANVYMRVDLKAPEGEEGRPNRAPASTDVVILPTDPEFATVLAAARAAYARKAAKAGTDLEGTGITITPRAAPAAPAGGNPNR